MISLDELVLEMRNIMELSYMFQFEKEEQLLKSVYDLLKTKLEKFYRECYLASYTVLDDSLFYAVSLIKAYQDDEVLKEMAIGIKDYIGIVKKELYVGNNQGVIKK